MVNRLDAPRRWPRWLVQVILGLGIAGLTLAGVIAVGNATRDSLGAASWSNSTYLLLTSMDTLVNPVMFPPG